MIRVDETDPVGEIEPSFPYRDVTIRRGVQFTDKYDIESEIGRGKFGTVYRCKEKSGGLALAAKVVNTGRKEDRRAVEREVEIMRRLQHPRLIQLYDAIATNNNIYVVLELIEGGELFERVIDDDFVLTERSCAVFMRQICEGIEFVHGQNILHLDLKPENILCLTKEGNRIKIIDFGLAREYDPEKKLQVLFGTPEFVAPEVVNFDQIGFGTDMWSIGVICYVLLSGLSPFMGDTDIETMANVTVAKYDFDDEAFAEISQDAKDFIKNLLIKDKGGRATASRCRAHPWLTRKVSPVVSLPEISTTRPEIKPEKSIQSMNGTRNELEVTKDNLRLFVERWREHPDSPYAVESPGCPQPETLNIGDSSNTGLESASTRGQSPSPCGSICSSSDSTVIENGSLLVVPGAGGSRGAFDRRASEGTATSGHEKPRDPAAQIVLAEEIIKLSEHLRAIALGQNIGVGSKEGQRSSGVVESSEIGNTIEASSSRERSKKIENIKNNKDHEEAGRNVASNSGRVSTTEQIIERDNEISEKLSRIVKQRKTNGTAFAGVGKFAKNSSFESSTTEIGGNFGPTAKKTVRRPADRGEENVSSENRASTSCSSVSDSGWKKRGTLSRMSHFSSFNSSVSSENAENQRLMFSDGNSPVKESSKIHESVENSSSSSFYSSKFNKEIDMTPPWRRGGKLHRFSETCRDVPRVSNLHDIHRSLNLDEPTSTKNLLLQLLEEWDDGQTGNRPNGIGRKSFSVDWCGEESVARRSMNSLAEYFQSEQKKPQPCDPIPNSVHR